MKNLHLAGIMALLFFAGLAFSVVPPPSPPEAAPTSAGVVYGFITQHEDAAPTLFINKNTTIAELSAVEVYPGVYDIVSDVAIFKELKTHFYLAPQDNLADLTSGLAYGSRLDDNTIRIINWNLPSGFPISELNSLCFTIITF